ncbi:hypothetical protein HPG69_012386 [Diceros bicornis minor]|uniref:Uncharacterized protein n=1 Tax=Diceros bicornis minor TaxID=77932 RepID=A0A7J7FL77_DICBM|nr:hypothetical protein HPG69_012386 [Diceros bicornis minor]
MSQKNVKKHQVSDWGEILQGDPIVPSWKNRQQNVLKHTQNLASEFLYYVNYDPGLRCER